MWPGEIFLKKSGDRGDPRELDPRKEGYKTKQVEIREPEARPISRRALQTQRKILDFA